MPLILRAAKDEAEILIYDTIGQDFWGDDVTAKSVDKELKALGSPKSITVRINSGGGDVFDGVAIYNTLARHPARKVVHVDGLAASAASVIAMAGDEILMGAGTFIMIHNAWSIAIGNAAEMRRSADLLDSVSGQLATIYVNRTGQSAKEVKAMMDAETWLDRDEAMKKGFADGASTDFVKASSSIDARAFRNMPAALRGSLRDGVLHMQTRGGPVARPRRDALMARIAASHR